MMIRAGDWKLIAGQGSAGFSKSDQPAPDDPPGQLYQLRDDPAERNNLYQKHPERVAELTNMLKEIVDAPATRPR
jgi:arylsulfatase A-like enzyme